jgi:hypothetical protein
MLSFSAGIQAIVWQECYTRWRVLHSTIYTNDPSNPIETQDSGYINLTIPQVSTHVYQVNYDVFSSLGHSISVAKPYVVPGCFEWILHH